MKWFRGGRVGFCRWQYRHDMSASAGRLDDGRTASRTAIEGPMRRDRSTGPVCIEKSKADPARAKKLGGVEGADVVL